MNALGQGNLSFAGGALQYSALNTADYSTRIANSTGAVSIDTNSQNITFAGNLAPSNTGGFDLKSGAGNLTLPVAEAYTGTTTIAGGGGNARCESEPWSPLAA